MIVEEKPAGVVLGFGIGIGIWHLMPLGEKKKKNITLATSMAHVPSLKENKNTLTTGHEETKTTCSK